MTTLDRVNEVKKLRELLKVAEQQGSFLIEKCKTAKRIFEQIDSEVYQHGQILSSTWKDIESWLASY